MTPPIAQEESRIHRRGRFYPTPEDSCRYKTKLCRTFMTTGVCTYGDRCMFAHGDDQLRTKESNCREGLTSTKAIRGFLREHVRGKNDNSPCPSDDGKMMLIDDVDAEKVLTEVEKETEENTCKAKCTSTSTGRRVWRFNPYGSVHIIVEDQEL